MLIEPAEFSRRGEVRSGDVAVGSLPRLSAVVLDADSRLQWQASGEYASVPGAITASGRGAFLTLAVSGVLKLRCQRCLEALEWPVDIGTRILMVPESEPLPDEELEVEDFDAIPVGRELNLAELIEDELLLVLPLAPMHAQCALPGPAENGEKKSPFAVLSQLKRGH